MSSGARSASEIETNAELDRSYAGRIEGSEKPWIVVTSGVSTSDANASGSQVEVAVLGGVRARADLPRDQPNLAQLKAGAL